MTQPVYKDCQRPGIWVWLFSIGKCVVGRIRGWLMLRFLAQGTCGQQKGQRAGLNNRGLGVTDTFPNSWKWSELSSVPACDRGLTYPVGTITLSGFLWAPWGQDLCGSHCYCPVPSTQPIPGGDRQSLEPDCLSLSLGSAIPQPLNKWLCLSVSRFSHL